MKAKKKSNLRGNTFVKTVLEVFANHPAMSFNFRQVAAQLGIQDSASRELVKNILHQLFQSEIIVQQKRGKYQINPNYVTKYSDKNTITGIVDMKSTGKAYIISEETSEDVFISYNNTNRSLHGDKVKVLLFPKRKNRKLEGRIVEVIERSKKDFVGVVQSAGGKFAFLVPHSQNMPFDIYIPISEINNAKDGEKAIAQITDWPESSKNPFGKIIHVLGQPGDNEVEMNSILAEFDFPLSFPSNVEAEAEKIPEIISQSEIDRRRDFRRVTTFTIDPWDAKDFDDALSFQQLKDGTYEIGVHIADVSHYVKPGTALEKEAYRRATSVYLVDRTIPMLPEKLSNMVCSLRPNEDKLCFSAVFKMDKEGKVLKTWIGKTIINSDRRFTYEEAQEIIEGADGDLKDEILILNDLASKLREKRFSNGSIAFNSQEVKFRLDETGKPIETYVKVSKEANKLIEDFMLLANKAVAEYVGKPKKGNKPKTFIYRIHNSPHPEKLQTFAEFIAKLGYSISMSSRKSISFSLNNLFEEIEGKGEQNMIETIAIRTMAKAVYSTENIGHYGLAFSFYSHFTSPIRRYPDLMAHRLLFSYLNGGQSALQADYEEKCEHSSIMEKKAAEAERASVKYKQAEYLLDHIGEQFDGVISGVSKWGLFVELDGCKCEGLVPLNKLQDDFYYLDEDNYQVVGQKFGNVYQLGSKVRVKVLKVDLIKKQMDFELINEE